MARWTDTDRTSAALWIDPARMVGQVCLFGTRLTAEAVAGVAYQFGLDEVTRCWPELAERKRDVLVACWWAALDDPHRFPLWHRWALDLPSIGELPEPPLPSASSWRRRWDAARGRTRSERV